MLLVDCIIVVETMEDHGDTYGMVVVVGLLDNCRLSSGLLEENIVEEYLPS